MTFTYADLQKWVSDGEGPTIEFKSSAQKDTGKTISAFANGIGGMIVIGIESKNEERWGLIDSDKESRRLQGLLDDCRPKPQTNQEFIHHEGKHFIILSVEQVLDSQNPCEFQGQYYVRQGTTNHKLVGEERIEFLRRRAMLSFEESRTHATLGDLDSDKLHRYFKTRNVEVNLKDEKELKARLAALRMASLNGTFFLKNLSPMFFAKDPTKFFSNLEVRIVKYRGKDKTLENIVSDDRISSTIPELIETTFHEISKRIGKQYRLVGAKREEGLEYPEDALREVVTNAIGHRDYFDNQDVLIEIFEDRLVITNPGGLLPGQTQANFDQNPKHRNPLMYRLLHDLKLGEGLGLVIQKIRTQLRKMGLPDPDFFNLGGAFRVVFYNVASGKKHHPTDFENPRQKQLLAYIKEYKSIKAKQYAKLVGISQPTATGDLNELIRQGKIKRVGKYRGAYYIIDKL